MCVYKMKILFSLFVEKKYDIIGLQETHWKDEFIQRYKHLWNGEIIYNNYDRSAKGVAFWELILINSPMQLRRQTESERVFGPQHKSSLLTRLIVLEND